MAIAAPPDGQPRNETSSSALLATGSPTRYREPQSECRYKLMACLYPACICWVELVSHYARDLPGTLENEIEAAFNIDPLRYQALNAAYFAPNLILPVIAGAIAQLCGAGRVFVACAVVAALGHGLLGYTAQSLSYGCFFFGRIVLGTTYEAFDVLAIALMAPLYPENWGLIVGISSSCLRLGSVLTFVVSPAMYNAAGLDAALWVSSCLGFTGLAAACLGICFFQKKLQLIHLPAETTIQGMEGERCVSQQVSPNNIRSTSGCNLGVVQQPLTSPSSSEDSDKAISEGSGKFACGMAPLALASLLLYSAIGMFFYAALVPFWFYGGAFIRNKWSYSLEATDTVMLIPEATEMVLAVPTGFLVDRLRLGAQARVQIMAFCLVVIAGSLSALAFSSASALAPTMPMAALGVGYAMNNTIFWSLCSTLIPARYLALGSGILGGVVNIGATVLPMLMANSESGGVAVLSLASLGLLAVALACVLQHVLGAAK